MAQQNRVIFSGTLKIQEYQFDDEENPRQRYTIDIWSPGQRKGVVEVLEFYIKDIPQPIRVRELKEAFSSAIERAIANDMFSGFKAKGES